MAEVRVAQRPAGPDPDAGPDDLPSAGAVEVALLDRDGVVVAVNDAWRAFARAGGGDPARTGVGTSYLAACDADAGDPAAQAVGAAVRAAVRGELPAALRVEVPCPGPAGERWFDVLVSSRLDDDGRCLGATVTLTPVPPPPAPPPAGGQSALSRLLASVPGLTEGRPERLDDVPAAARELLGARTAVLTLLSGDGSLSAVLSDGAPPPALGAAGEAPEALGLLGLLLRRSGPLRLDDVRTHPAAARAAGSGPLLGTPVTSRGRVLGALYVVGEPGAGFTERDEALLGALAAYAATTLDVARRRQALDERQRWAQLARELTARPLADEPELLALVVRLAGRGLGAGDTALVLADGDRPGRVVRSAPQGRVAPDGAADPVVLRALRSGRPACAPPGGPTTAAVPLRVGGRVLGALAVARGTGLSEDEVQQLEGLLHHAGLALQLLRARSDRRALEQLRAQVDRAAGVHDEAVRALASLAPGPPGTGDPLGEVLRLLQAGALALRAAGGG